MKKIIALAVASAFVAPAFAADVSISGSMAQYFVNDEVVGDSQDVINEETAFTIGASSEANNGLTVSAAININGEGSPDGGQNITVAHASFGKIVVGNPSSAIDAVDDKTEILELMDPLSGNADSAVLWTLPAVVDGLTINVSYSPNDGGANVIGTAANGITTLAGDEVQGDNDQAVDESGVSLAYQMGPVRLAYGQNDEAAEENTFVGIQYSASGIMVAYEQNETTLSATNVSTDNTAAAVQYTTGPISVKYLTTNRKSAGTTSIDRTAYGVHYDLGGGLKAVIEAGSEDKQTSKGEFTGFGLKYSF